MPKLLDAGASTDDTTTTGERRHRLDFNLASCCAGERLRRGSVGTSKGLVGQRSEGGCCIKP
jgi:hypothetical protein